MQARRRGDSRGTAPCGCTAPLLTHSQHLLLLTKDAMKVTSWCLLMHSLAADMRSAIISLQAVDSGACLAPSKDGWVLKPKSFLASHPRLSVTQHPDGAWSFEAPGGGFLSPAHLTDGVPLSGRPAAPDKGWECFLSPCCHSNH